MHRKNLQRLGGRSLVEITADSALAARSLSSVVLSSEDPNILDHAGSIRGLATLRRPKLLSQDDTKSFEVLLHACHEYEAILKQPLDVVVLLQPTCPFRTPDMIDKCVDILKEDPSCDSVCTIVCVQGNHPARMYTLNNGAISHLWSDRRVEFAPRQELPELFIRSGDVYAIRIDALKVHKSLLGTSPRGVVIDPKNAVNIDSYNDLEYARYKLSDTSLDRVKDD